MFLLLFVAFQKCRLFLESLFDLYRLDPGLVFGCFFLVLFSFFLMETCKAI